MASQVDHFGRTINGTPFTGGWRYAATDGSFQCAFPAQDDVAAMACANENPPPHRATKTPVEIVDPLRGPKGDKGDPGINATGRPGINGATWYTFAGTPINLTGNDDDLFLNTITGDVSKKVSGVWMPNGNIRGPAGVSEESTTQHVIFHHPLMAASAVATNLAANVVNAVSDPNLRQFIDLRGLRRCRIHGRLGGSVNFATRIRLQFHVGGNVSVATGDAGWQILADTTGSHAANTMFRSAELSVPVEAQIQNCIVRAVIFSGDGAADPVISCCIVDFFN